MQKNRVLDNSKTLISRDQQLTKILPWWKWKHSSHQSTHHQKAAKDKIERKEQQLPLSSRGKLITCENKKPTQKHNCCGNSDF